jgi:NAD(P)-dependent dehydrogenase (short-subunit alcohol dehydrogenase family)
MERVLSGKVALITGGSRGLGAATARLFAKQGADVAISFSSSVKKAEVLVEELKRSGVRAKAFKADQGKAAEAAKLISDVVGHFGKLDILVNNAAIAVQGHSVDDPEADLEAFDRQYAVNVTGVIATIRAAVLVLSDSGRIVSVGSGVVTRAGRAGTADYAATKGAILAYSKGVARDLGKRNITVNVVLAGVMDTDMAAPYLKNLEPIIASRAIQRVGRPEEVAAGILFLASPDASYITGSALTIDGGYNA